MRTKSPVETIDPETIGETRTVFVTKWVATRGIVTRDVEINDGFVVDRSVPLGEYLRPRDFAFTIELARKQAEYKLNRLIEGAGRKIKACRARLAEIRDAVRPIEED